jgi:hypothetical protein
MFKVLHTRAQDAASLVFWTKEIMIGRSLTARTTMVVWNEATMNFNQFLTTPNITEHDLDNTSLCSYTRSRSKIYTSKHAVF